MNIPITRTKWQLADDDCCSNYSRVGETDIDWPGSLYLACPAVATTARPTPLSFGSSSSDARTGNAQDFDTVTKLDAVFDIFNDMEGIVVQKTMDVPYNCLELGYYSAPLCNRGATAVTPLNVINTTVTSEQDVAFSQNEIYAARSLKEALGGYTFGNLRERKYNLFNSSCDDCSQTEWKVADLIMQLGYDFYKCDDRHLGLYVKAIIPTGTQLDQCWAQYTFSPIIGNGHHFELGAGLSAHMDFCVCDDSMFSLGLDGYITHMFKKSQFRTFDQEDNPMSRYAVVREMRPWDNENGDFAEEYAYSGYLHALGDVNSRCVDVSIDLRGELVADLTYVRCNWLLGLGYAFSGQSKEKICDSCCDSNSQALYGYKGVEGETLLEFAGNGPGNTATEIKIDGAGATFSRIAYGWSPLVVVDGKCTVYDNPEDVVIARSEDLFSLPDINCSGLMNGQILHRIFGHIDYVWADCCWQPEIGILGSFGWTQDCYRTAEYWDVGGRLGFSF